MPARIPQTHDDGAEARDILYLAGGAALILFGAGLAMSHPAIRRSVKGAMEKLMPEIEPQIRNSIGGVLPDIERYLKLRSM